MSKARELAALGNAYSDGALSNRNLIINGAMQVAQRGTSETGVTTSGYYAVDRMRTQISGSTGTHTISQSTDAPSDFVNSYKIECTTAQASPSQLRFATRLEGYSVSHLNYNTSSAKELTLSFWVKSNVTGTYAISLETTVAGRYFNTTYTIDSADTWEYKTVSIIGDTASTLNKDNTLGLDVSWWLAAGSGLTNSGTPDVWVTNGSYTTIADGLDVNIAGSTSNYWQITGVQLEVGDTATPFEHRSYGDELARCQRYYQRFEHNDSTNHFSLTMIGAYWTATQHYCCLPLCATMRVNPTLQVSGSDALKVFGAGSSSDSTGIALDIQGATMMEIRVDSPRTEEAVFVRINGTDDYLALDAEL